MKVSELTGAMLDYWVSQSKDFGWSKDVTRAHKAKWRVIEHSRGATCYYTGADGSARRKYSPSTDWVIGGKIIDDERICIEFDGVGDEWTATILVVDNRKEQCGDTALIAAMRAYVANKIGEDVPEIVAHLK